MNNGIDIAFLVTKVATLNNEKAKIFVDAASFAYNIAEVSRLQSLIVEYSQVCNYIVLNAKYRGYYTEDEFNLANEVDNYAKAIPSTYNGVAERKKMLQFVSICLRGEVSARAQLSITRDEMIAVFDDVLTPHPEEVRFVVLCVQRGGGDTQHHHHKQSSDNPAKQSISHKLAHINRQR